MSNGLAYSSDEKYFYLASGADSKVFRYDERADGTIGNRSVVIDMSTDANFGNPDGMKVDARSNLYSTGSGDSWIISPTGKHLGTI